MVDPPRAISSAMALKKASLVIISLGLISLFTRSTAFIPVCFASRTLSEKTDGMLPLKGRDIPSASDKWLIVLAVNIPEQDPAPVQALHSYSMSSSSVIFPMAKRPTASKTLSSPISFPSTLPASMGPPETKMEGIFNLAAAMSIPGMILSHEASSTRPSKG